MTEAKGKHTTTSVVSLVDQELQRRAQFKEPYEIADILIKRIHEKLEQSSPLWPGELANLAEALYFATQVKKTR